MKIMVVISPSSIPLTTAVIGGFSSSWVTRVVHSYCHQARVSI